MAKPKNPNNTTGSLDDTEYHFTTVEPGSAPVIGWKDRPALIDGAGSLTQCVHAGVQPDPAHGAVMPPIYHSSTFAFRDIHTNTGFDYTRSANPTRMALEEAITVLEGGEGGVCTSTGMSAILVALQMVKTGEHLICTNDCYGGTFRILEHIERIYGVQISFVDLTDIDAVRAAIRPETRMIWIETPSNPLLRVTDLEAVCGLAKEHKLLTVVDNTFMSPALQRPFEFGADLVIHSTTKYINGHSDTVGGAVIARKGLEQLSHQAFALANVLGVTQAPIDAFFVIRGLKTLELRMQQHQVNATRVAEWLDGHDLLETVMFPGLPGHPQHELAKKQQAGFGGMVTFRIKGGLEAANTLLRNVTLFTLAESLGGVESLICHPASMTHFSMTPEARKAAGITDDVVRLSIGIEDADDLIADLDRAFAAVARSTAVAAAK